MYFLVILFNFFLFQRFCDRHEVHRVQTHTMQIDKHRHNRTIGGEFGSRTTGLQTLSQHCCSLTGNTWYNTTFRLGH